MNSKGAKFLLIAGLWAIGLTIVIGVLGYVGFEFGQCSGGSHFMDTNPPRPVSCDLLPDALGTLSNQGFNLALVLLFTGIYALPIWIVLIVVLEIVAALIAAAKRKD